MPREKSKGRPPRGERTMRSTRTDQLVRARKAGHAAGAKGLGQAVVVNVQLATGGDLGGNEAVRHPEDADAVRLLGGSGNGVDEGLRGGHRSPTAFLTRLKTRGCMGLVKLRRATGTVEGEMLS